MTGLAGNGGHVVGKCGVVHGVNANAHARCRGGIARQGGHQDRVRRFIAHRGSVFAVQRHVKNASAEFLGHLCLQLQALEHARRRTAVVIANRQGGRSRLRTQQHIARMGTRDPTTHGVGCFAPPGRNGA